MREQTGLFRQSRHIDIGASPTDERPKGWTGKRLVRGSAIALIGGLFLALSGAFQTGQFSLGLRVVYWVGLLELGTALNVGLDTWAQRSRIPTIRPLVFTVVSFVALTVVLTPVVVTVTGWVYGGRNGPGHFGYIAVAVALISAVMTGVNMLAERPPLLTHAAPALERPLTPAKAPQAQFEARLPPKLRGASLYAVEAQDHYLRLHTSRGSDLILMRLSDALAELKGIEGAQVHRSWWVARDAVVEAQRADGRAVLILPSGAEAPVSRTYLKALREAGWL